ncbi:hypothetical protein D3C72_2563710 [compost metagenome]
MEINLRNALAISGGDISILFQSTISIVLWVMAAMVAILPLYLSRRAKKRRLLSALEV